MSPLIFLRLRYSVLLLSFLFLQACAGQGSFSLGSSAVGLLGQTGDYLLSRENLSSVGISDQDFNDLKSGRLSILKARYDSKSYESLSFQQLRLVCDLEFKFQNLARTESCLTVLTDRYLDKDERINPKDLKAVLGRKSLLYLHQGNYQKVYDLSKELDSPGKEYLKGLAALRLNKRTEALDEAKKLARYEGEPEYIYYAASLYLAAEQFPRSLELVKDPRTRLLRDYGLDAVGKDTTATFRLDIFGDLKFGWFDSFSYAPKGNHYVEYIAAKSALESKLFPEARERLQKLHDNPDIKAYRDLYWMVLYDLGLLLEYQGQHHDAMAYHREAIGELESIRSSILTETGRIGFVSNKYDVYQHLIDDLLKGGDYQSAIEIVERAKSRTLVDLLGSRDNFGTAESGKRSERLLSRLREAETNLSNVQVGGSAEKSLRDIRVIREELVSSEPSLASLVTVVPVEYQRLLTTLGSDETGILFQTFANKIYVFAFQSGKIYGFTVNRKIIENEVQTVRSLLDKAKKSRQKKAQLAANAKTLKTYTQRLYKALLAPLAEKISFNKTLVIAPTGNLYYLPFSILHDGQAYLTEKHAIRITPSFQALTLLENYSPVNDKMLIFGNPDLGHKKFSLPSAEVEAKAIAKMNPNSKLLVGRKASKQAFLQQVSDFGYIHIAAHGKFYADKPLTSSIFLAPSVQEPIRVNDLYGLRMNAQLVVLSACETGLSDIRAGDDMLGLARGLMYSGAKGLIGSLWEVDDDATSLLMEAFYKALFKQSSADEALRLAQVEVLKSHGHPYFWSAFQYTGAK